MTTLTPTTAITIIPVYHPVYESPYLHSLFVSFCTDFHSMFEKNIRNSMSTKTFP